MDDFGDFLQGLRGQIERCAAEAAPVDGKKAAAIPRRTTRIAALTAVGLAAAATRARARRLVARPRNRAACRPAGHERAHARPSAARRSAPRRRSCAPAGSSRAAAPDPGYHLLDVAARTANDIWAVGFLTTVTSGGETTSSLVLHWDGSAWRQVRTPEVGAVRAIAVDADGNAWAAAWGSASDGPATHAALGRPDVD